MIERIYVVITAIVGLLKIVMTHGTSGIVTDEIQYKEMIMGLGEKHLFNPVYVLTYKTALIGGENWYLMIKLINLGMVLLGCIFIIGICKSIKIEKTKRAIIYICSVLSGTTTYMINAMPESMFTAVLYGCIYILVKKEVKNRTIIMALANGVLALIKPHAIILVPGFIAGLLNSKNRRIRDIIVDIGKYIAIFAFMRWGIGGIMDGELSKGIFGGVYEEMGKSISDVKITDVMYVGSRHILAWIIMIPMIVISRTRRQIDRNSNKEGIKTLGISVWTMMAMSIATYALFTVMVNNGWNDQLTRVHLRYYIYMLPLVMIIFMENTFRGDWDIIKERSSLIRGVGAILIVASIGLFYGFNYTPLKYSWIETPTLAYLQNIESIGLTIVAITLIIIGSINKRGMIASGSICLFGLMCSEVLQAKQMRDATRDSKRSIQNMEEIRTHTGEEKIDIVLRDDGTVYGTRKDMIECMKMLFIQRKESYKDSCRKRKKRDEAGYEVYLGQEEIFSTSSRDKYCEVGRNHRIQGKEYILYKKRTAIAHEDINKNVAISLSGVHKKEGWGYWAKDKVVELRVNDEYKENLIIKMKVRSIGLGEVMIRGVIYEIKSNKWKEIKVDVPKKILCRNSIEISYSGDTINEDGRRLKFAIKDITVEKK